MLILDLATEDFVGLWEIVWRARTVAVSNGSGISEAELRSETIRLMEKDLIHLYQGMHFTGDERKIDQERATSIVANPSNWVPPTSAMDHYRIAASDHGESQYRELFRQ